MEIKLKVNQVLLNGLDKLNNQIDISTKVRHHSALNRNQWYTFTGILIKCSLESGTVK